jgi:hypothetical protein
MNKKGLLLLFLFLLLSVACSRYYRYGEEFGHTVMIERFIFGGSFSTIEYYLAMPPDILPGLDKSVDLSCEVK